MNISLGELIVWLIVGGLVGSLVGMLVKRKKEGFGHWINMGIGLVGAVIGGVIFNVFNINLGLGEIAVSFEDLVSAFVGSLMFLLAIWIVRQYRQDARAGKSDK